MDIWIGRVSYPLGIIHHKEQHELNKPGEPSFMTGELSPSIFNSKMSSMFGSMYSGNTSRE